VLLVLLFFLCRRRRRGDDFDGNFDPDRVVGLSGGRDGATLPHVDLAGADEVEPYTYNPSGNGSLPGSHVGGDEMRQHSNIPAFLAGGLAGAGAGAAAAGGRGRPNSTSPPPTGPPSNYSQSHSQSQSHYAPSSSEPYPDYSGYSSYGQHQPQGYAGAPDFRQPSPGPSLAMTNSTQQTNSGSGGAAAAVLPSMKEREAMARRSGMQVVNQGEVVQHQDGGRLDSTPEEENVPNEIPPRYDQIHRDQ